MNENEFKVLLTAIQIAGDAAEAIRLAGSFSVQRKLNTTPLTIADVQANEILKDKLLSSFPNDGWLSEESE